ncbi:hypothetical protein BAME_33230 [Bacillus sp. M 2-6]|nr:hypothetical protein BAME_33230 [Bacillus sp. M 2-6]
MKKSTPEQITGNTGPASATITLKPGRENFSWTIDTCFQSIITT